MELIEKRIYFVNLLHAYGDLLSNTQLEILKDYFECDLSITEIAETRGISRAAVEDALKKGTSKLEQIESKVHYLEKKEIILKNSALLTEKFGICEEIEKIEEALK